MVGNGGFWGSRRGTWVSAITGLVILVLAVWALFVRPDTEALILETMCVELEEHRRRSELHHKAVFDALGIPFPEPAPHEAPIEGCPE